MRFASPHFRIGLAACGSLLLTGCPTIRTPDFYHPGSAGQQRAAALQFDPYPLDDVAPAVAGTRPREYDRPIPEVKRGQTYTPKRPKLQPIPWPTLNMPTLPTLTAPATPAPGVPYQFAPTVPSAPVYQVRPPY
jgi:hypothetical protein